MKEDEGSKEARKEGRNERTGAGASGPSLVPAVERRKEGYHGRKEGWI